MIRRFCDICEAEIPGLKDGLHEERYTLLIEDPVNLSRLGGQTGKTPPAIELRLRDCHNMDICLQCLEKVLTREFHRRQEEDHAGSFSGGRDF